MGFFNSEFLLFINLLSLVSGLPISSSPFSQMPFLSVWNAPTESCLSQYGINLDLDTFSITMNNNQTFMGDNITIFYSGKLGLYPWYTAQSKAINGGVPQNANLDEHLRVASDNIRTFIPDRDFQGLAVVDWENWRPVWERNWDSKQVYWEASRVLVKSRHPDWSPAQVEAAARIEFEKAGRKFMEETLKLGKEERPGGLWGFYGFPNCYNPYNPKIKNYTGECPAVDKKWNDELVWLWNVSSALYPDIYLSLELRGLSREVLLYTHHRILEAMRAGAQSAPVVPPVFPYARIVYTYTLDFLSQEHLVYTIGESAALGSAGVVLWGDLNFAKSKISCSDLDVYLRGPLGKYLLNVSTAAELCSQTLCASHGRCLRKNPDSDVYLHLDPLTHSISSRDGRHKVSGALGEAEEKSFRTEFQCQCYSGYEGEGCNQIDPMHQKGAAPPITSTSLQFVILLIISLLFC